jgi:hypothetical protein
MVGTRENGISTTGVPSRNQTASIAERRGELRGDRGDRHASAERAPTGRTVVDAR